MAADHPAHQPLVGEVVDAAVPPVALSGGVDQRQIARPAGGEEALLQGLEQCLGHAGADEAAGGDGLAVSHERHGVGGGEQLPVAGDRHAHHPPLTWIVCPVT